MQNQILICMSKLEYMSKSAHILNMHSVEISPIIYSLFNYQGSPVQLTGILNLALKNVNKLFSSMLVTHFTIVLNPFPYIPYCMHMMKNAHC